jgi:hypothetical protein
MAGDNNLIAAVEELEAELTNAVREGQDRRGGCGKRSQAGKKAPDVAVKGQFNHAQWGARRGTREQTVARARRLLEAVRGKALLRHLENKVDVKTETDNLDMIPQLITRHASSR